MRHQAKRLPFLLWERIGYIESFNGKLRDELLNREISTTLFEAQVLIENWKQDYNQIRPPGALGYRPNASEVLCQAMVQQV